MPTDLKPGRGHNREDVNFVVEIVEKGKPPRLLWQVDNAALAQVLAKELCRRQTESDRAAGQGRGAGSDGCHRHAAPAPAVQDSDQRQSDAARGRALRMPNHRRDGGVHPPLVQGR
jgi:hypothetical protein